MPSPANGTPTSPSSAEVGEVASPTGIVEMTELNEEGNERPAAAGASIRLGQALRTGRRSSVRVTFDRDGEILLGESTRVSFLPAENPTHCRGSRRIAATVSLEEGIFKVRHDKNSGPDVVEVKTQSALVCLTGTEVVVKAGNSGTTEVQVLSGSVEVTSRSKKVRRPGPFKVGEPSSMVVELDQPPSLPLPAPASRKRLAENVLSFVFDPYLWFSVLDGIDPGGIARR